MYTFVKLRYHVHFELRSALMQRIGIRKYILPEIVEWLQDNNVKYKVYWGFVPWTYPENPPNNSYSQIVFETDIDAAKFRLMWG